MPLDDFSPEEYLYRSIKKGNPNLWKEKQNRPTSAAFKDTKGLSVDRQGGRLHKDVCTSIQEKFDSFAVAFFTVAQGKRYNAIVRSDEIPENLHHCIVENPDGSTPLTDTAASNLAILTKDQHYKAP